MQHCFGLDIRQSRVLNESVKEEGVGNQVVDVVVVHCNRKGCWYPSVLIVQCSRCSIRVRSGTILHLFHILSQH
jgi:hypothetical protein